MDLNGLKLSSGGIHVETGGISVSSGGLVVKSGGLTIETGKLDIKDADMLARSIQAKAPSTVVNGSIISAASDNENFVGNIIHMKGP